MRKTIKTAVMLAITLSAGLTLAGIVHAQQKVMSIGTGGTGGVYYPLGGAVANVLSKTLPNVQATAEVTGGSVDNLKLISTGQSELGFTMADAALDALKGQDKFKNNKVAAAGAARGLSEPHACGHGRRHRHQHHGGPQGQARLDRLARRRHRGDGVSRHRGLRPRQGQGPDPRTARRRRIRQRHQGPQDRRVLLGRRHPDRRRDRPRGNAGLEDEADRPLRGGRQDERQIRQALYREQDQGRLLSRRTTRTTPLPKSGI